MQRKPEVEEFCLDRFEDPYDMLDHIYEKLDHAIFLWAIWSKCFGCESEQDALRLVLSEIVDQESKFLSKSLKVEITKEEGGSWKINAISRLDHK